jgi:photosystem II stability/assembly factor-like uncharacterized protein
LLWAFLGATLVLVVLSGWLLGKSRSHVAGPYNSPELGSTLRSLLVRGGETLLIGTRGATALTSDGGRKLALIPALDGFDTMESAADSSGQTIFVAGPTGALLSSDGGDRWRDPTGSLPGRDIEGLALDRGAPASVIVYVIGSGLFATDDAGGIWRPLTPPPAQPVGTGLLRDRFILMPALPSGLLRSSDGGAHWSLIATDAGGTLVAADPRRASRLFFSGSGPLYISLDGGNSWSPQSLPDGAQLVTATDSGTLFAAGYTAGRHAVLWRSGDHGQDWTMVLPPLP